jgi:hypothetical protein
MKTDTAARGIARENAMQWAMQTALAGEDPMAILARAQLYEEYVLAPLSPESDAAAPDRRR